MLDTRSIKSVLAAVAPYTIVPPESLEVTIKMAIRAIDIGVPGDIVEAGVWKGGCSFAMLLAQRAKYGKIVKPVWMFDSFEGLPPADKRDGPAAARYQAEPNAPDFMDNCAAPLEDVRAAIRRFGFSDREAIVVPGWFDKTFDKHVAQLTQRGIAVLRIDCDWYSSVRLTLDKFEPLVAKEGTIIIDDYFPWDGCTRAVHDYLSQNDLPYRIRSMDNGFCAWMVKQPEGRRPIPGRTPSGDMPHSGATPALPPGSSAILRRTRFAQFIFDRLLKGVWRKYE